MSAPAPKPLLSPVVARVGWVLLLSAGAALGDWYGPRLLAGHSLVLGLVFYLIALRRLGPHFALPVLVASAVTLAIKWQQPFSALAVALEGLWIGWFWRRQRNPFLAEVLYWMIVGTPVTWLIYNFVQPLAHPALELAMVVQPINGLIAVWIAYLVLSQLPEERGGGTGRPQPGSFRALLFNRYVIFGTFPAMLVGFLAARNFETMTMAEARETLRRGAGQLATQISYRTSLAAVTVQSLASRLAAAEPREPSAQQRELVAAQAESSLFLCLRLLDPAGRTLAVAPAGYRLPAIVDEPAGAGPGAGRPTPDRRARFVGTFLLPGPDGGLVLMVNAPVVNAAAEVTGTVQGFLPLSSLRDGIRGVAESEAWRVLLTDRKVQVVTGIGFDYAPQTPIQDTPLGLLIRRKPPAPVRFAADMGARQVSVLSHSVEVPGVDWTVTVQREWIDILRPVLIAYMWTLFVGVATTAIAAVFVTWSIRDILSAWQKLINFARAPVVKSSMLKDVGDLRLPREFDELLHNLGQMADRLEAAQQKREQLLAELETRVHDRTRDLEIALGQAQAADRAKSAFLATVSHELRTPLTAIVAGIHLLERGKAARSALELRTLDTLKKSSEVLMHVISDVLDFSRLESSGLSAEYHFFRPAELVGEVAAIMEPGAQRSGLEVRIQVRHRADLLWNSDVKRLRQVLLNLVGNAVKFTPAGTVDVAAWVEDAVPGSRRLHFAIRDTGPGIPPDQLERIFEPFVQLESNRVRSHAGTGLGLSISRRIVELLGGRLTVKSGVGEGTEFLFWVPEGAVDAGTIPPPAV